MITFGTMHLLNNNPLRIETENAKVANFELPPPQLIQATFSEGISEYGI